MMQARRAITALFQRGQKLKQVRQDIPAPILARTFQQFIFGTELLWALAPPGEDLHKWLDGMLEVFWNGAAGQSIPASREGKQL
jgi:hypothetical protein